MESVSRRSFLKASAVTLGGFAASAMLTACGEAEGGSTAKKKILRFGQANAKQGLDMQRSNTSASASIADSVTEPLLRWTEDNELVPQLLVSIPTFNDDGVTLPCELRSGVVFHDGSKLTSADVKYTFERMFLPETAGKSTSLYAQILGADDMLAGKTKELKGIQIQDDTHFTFILKEPGVTFVKNLGISYAEIFPKDACEKAGLTWGQGTNLIGTGRYKLVSNDDSTEVVLAAFDDYYGDKPLLDEIQYKYYDDPNTCILAYKNGDIDFCNVPANSLTQLLEDPAVKDDIHYYDQLGVDFVNLNLKEGFGLTDQRVRQALSLAINRQEMLDTLYNGSGTVASGWLAPQTPGSLKDQPPFEYNPEKAKALLEQAGVSHLKLSAKVRQGLSQKELVAIQGYWSKIGVDLDVQIEDNGAWSQDWTQGNLQVTLLQWFPLYADGDNHMYSYFHSSASAKKSSFYNNPEFDKLLDKARVSRDEHERESLYRRADELLTHQDVATLPLFWTKGVFAAKSYVKNARVGNLIYHTFEVDIDTTDPNYTTEG